MKSKIEDIPDHALCTEQNQIRVYQLGNRKSRKSDFFRMSAKKCINHKNAVHRKTYDYKRVREEALYRMKMNEKIRCSRASATGAVYV